MRAGHGFFCTHGAVSPRALFAAVLAVCLGAFGCGQAPATGSDSAVSDDTTLCDDSAVCEWIDPPEPDADAVIDASALDAGPTDAATAGADASIDAGPAPLPRPTCGDVNQRLRDDFGIIIRPGTTLAFEGLATEDIGCADRIKVYEMFMRPFAYQRYPVRLNPSDPFTMYLYRTASPASGSCSAYVRNAHTMQIRDLSQCLRVVSGTTDRDFIRIAMFLIHESGHIITSRNYSLRTAFQNANLPARDPRCYDRGFLKTYSLRTTNPVSESFAEATALFIGRRKVGPLGTITDFATECPNTFAWIQTTVFGNHL